jgi:hypothetical protein
MLEAPIRARILYATLAAVLNIGAGRLSLGYPVATVMLQAAVRLRIPDGAAMTVWRLGVGHAYPPVLHVGRSCELSINNEQSWSRFQIDFSPSGAWNHQVKRSRSTWGASKSCPMTRSYPCWALRLT